MKRLVILLLVLICYCNSQEFYTNPVIDTTFSTPDVCVWKGDSMYYMLYTGGVKKIVIFESSDLIRWKSTGISPFDDKTIMEFSNVVRKEHHPNDGMLWAPHVIQVGDKWNMYFSLSNKGGIVVLQSDFPKGPFHFVGEPRTLVTHEMMGWDYDAIDPFVAKDDDGLWLFFGSTFGIYARKLEKDGLSFLKGTDFIHVAGPKDPDRIVHGKKHRGYEGVFVYKYGEFWYCLVSKRNDYSIYVGRSRNITGPFVDAQGKLLTDGFGTRMNYPVDGFKSPGHNGEIIRDKTGRFYIFYHAKTKDIPGSGYGLRQAILSELVWENGFPYILNRGAQKFGNVKPEL